jgi:hypothetical protein
MTVVIGPDFPELLSQFKIKQIKKASKLIKTKEDF